MFLLSNLKYPSVRTFHIFPFSGLILIAQLGIKKNVGFESGFGNLEKHKPVESWNRNSVEIFVYRILSGPAMSKNQPSKRLSIQSNIPLPQKSLLATWMAPVILTPYNCRAEEGTQ